MTKRLGEDIIEEIRQKCDIVSIISEYMSLKKMGRNYQGLCPFHHEKTPSFHVNSEKQLFYCFGCQTGGDVFSFIMQIEKTDFWGAVELLAAKAGVTLDLNKQSDKDILYDATMWANRYYNAMLLKSKAAAVARDYLAKRNIDDATIAKFHLGYAPNDWNKLLTSLAQKGVKDTTLEQVGLVIPKKNGGYYDRFRHRLIIPILNRYNKVIGFGGRVLDDSLPKYLNSPETKLFSKSRSLYGIHAAKDKMREKRSVLMVEGYFDVISLSQAGIENVVASLGTALTSDHAKILKPLVDEVVIAYDGDAAGQHAAIRGMDILYNAGLRVRVLEWPEGHDPDSFVREKGKDAVEKLLQEALPWLEYGFNKILDGYDELDIEAKKKAFAESVELLNRLKNVVERDEHIRLVAQRIRMSEADLRHELGLAQKNIEKEDLRNQRGQEKAIKKPKNISKTEKAEREILLICLKESGVIKTSLADLTDNDFLNTEYKRIFVFIRELINSSIDKNIMDIDWAEKINQLDDGQLKDTMLSLLVEELPENSSPERIAADCFYVLKNERLNLLLKEKQEEIKVAEKRGESIRLLLRDYQELLQKKKILDRKGC